MTMPADRKSPFGLRFTTGLPEPFVVLFAVDPARAPELIKLSYRPVRIEGKFEPEAHLVWLDRHGRVSSVVSAPPLKAGEPAKPDPPQGEDAKPLYVIWFTITRFERAI